MNNKTFKIKTLLILFVLAFFFSITNVNASNNLLSNKEKWKGYFSGNQKQDKWTEAKGSLYSISTKKFVADIKSIGHWVEGDPWWHFGVQAQLPSQKLKLKLNNYYRYKATIKSDKTRNIYFKIVESEMNLTKGEYEDIDNILIEKWIPLKANTPYNFNEIFYATSNANRISIYYAMGWKEDTGIEQNSSNRVEVSNISITKVKTNNKKPNYKPITKNNKKSKYSYSNIIGTKKADINRNNKIGLYLSKDTSIVSKIIVNDKEIKIGTDINKVYIPVKLMKKEYNYVTVYSKTTNEHNDMVISKVIIKNNIISNYRKNRIKQISKYGNNKNSKTVNSIINRYKRYIADTKTKKEINKIYNEFKDNIKIQKQTESNAKISISSNTNTYKISAVGIIVVLTIVICIVFFAYKDEFPIIDKVLILVKEKISSKKKKTTKKKH